MDPCNASDLLCVNISGQLFLIQCVDYFCINLRRAAAGVCAMKTLLSCFSHFWASCKMLLHLLCLHCSAALNCTAAQCSKHTSAPGHLTWCCCCCCCCCCWCTLPTLEHFGCGQILPAFCSAGKFGRNSLLRQFSNSSVCPLSHTQWWPPSASLPKQKKCDAIIVDILQQTNSKVK